MKTPNSTNRPSLPVGFRKDRNGFTLIELLVVIAIISLLSSVVLASLSNARDRARRTAAQAQMGQIYTAFQQALNQSNGVAINTNEPPETTALVRNWWHAPDCSGPFNDTSSGDDWPNDSYVDNFAEELTRVGMTTIPKDPWGNKYVIDAVYDCNNNSVGCGSTTGYVYAIVSKGPTNDGVYGEDNVIYLICDHQN